MAELTSAKLVSDKVNSKKLINKGAPGIRVTKPITIPVPIDATTMDMRKPLLKSSTVEITPEVKVEAEAAVVRITGNNERKPNKLNQVYAASSSEQKVDVNQTRSLKMLLGFEEPVQQKLQNQAQKYGFEKILTSSKGARTSGSSKMDEFVRKQILINGVPANNGQGIGIASTSGQIIDPNNLEYNYLLDGGIVVKTLPGTSIEYRTPGATNLNKNGNIKRPMNAFMCWARTARQQICASMPYASNADVSIQLGNVWSSLTAEQKRPFYDEAEQIKKAHREQHPGWTYRPQPKKRRNEESYTGPSLYKKWKQEQAAQKAKEGQDTSIKGTGCYVTNKVEEAVSANKVSPLQYSFEASSPTGQCGGETSTPVASGDTAVSIKGRPPSSSIRTACMVLKTSVGSPRVPQASDVGLTVNTSSTPTASTYEQGDLTAEPGPLDLTINRDEQEAVEELQHVVSGDVAVEINIEEPVGNHVQYLQSTDTIDQVPKLEHNLQISAEVEITSDEVRTSNSKSSLDLQHDTKDNNSKGFYPSVTSDVAGKSDPQEEGTNAVATNVQPVAGRITASQAHSSHDIVCTGDTADLNNNFKSFPAERNNQQNVANHISVQSFQLSSNNSHMLNGSVNSGHQVTGVTKAVKPDTQQKVVLKKSNWADVSTLVNNSSETSHVLNLSQFPGRSTVTKNVRKDGPEVAKEGFVNSSTTHDQRSSSSSRATVRDNDSRQQQGIIKKNQIRNNCNVEPLFASNNLTSPAANNSNMPAMPPQVLATRSNDNTIYSNGQVLQESYYPQQHQQPPQQYNTVLLQIPGTNDPSYSQQARSETDPKPLVANSSQNIVQAQPPCNQEIQERGPVNAYSNMAAPVSAHTLWNASNLPQAPGTSSRCVDFRPKPGMSVAAPWWRFPFSRYPYDDHLREQAVAANQKGEAFPQLPVSHPQPQFGIKDLVDYDEDIPTSPPSVTQYDMNTARWFQPATHNSNIPQLELNRWISYMNDDNSPPGVCNEAERRRFRAFLPDSQSSCPLHSVCSMESFYPQQPYPPSSQPQQNWVQPQPNIGPHCSNYPQ